MTPMPNTNQGRCQVNCSPGNMHSTHRPSPGLPPSQRPHPRVPQSSSRHQSCSTLGSQHMPGNKLSSRDSPVRFHHPHLQWGDRLSTGPASTHLLAAWPRVLPGQPHPLEGPPSFHCTPAACLVFSFDFLWVFFLFFFFVFCMPGAGHELDTRLAGPAPACPSAALCLRLAGSAGD